MEALSPLGIATYSLSTAIVILALVWLFSGKHETIGEGLVRRRQLAHHNDSHDRRYVSIEACAQCIAELRFNAQPIDVANNTMFLDPSGVALPLAVVHRQ